MLQPAFAIDAELQSDLEPILAGLSPRLRRRFLHHFAREVQRCSPAQGVDCAVMWTLRDSWRGTL